jgi:SAM-dependent methyltransferase
MANKDGPLSKDLNLDDPRSAVSIFDKIWVRDKDLAKMNPAQIHRRRLTRYFLKKLKIRPQKILDIGCGSGELLKELAAVPLVRFCRLNAEAIQANPFLDPMNLITCCEVLEHCSDPRPLVKNAYQWLAPGGVFFFSVPAGPKTAYDEEIGHRRHFTTQEARELLESEGFCEVYVRSWEAPFHTFYRKLVGMASNRIKNKGKPSDYFPAYWLCCKIFNLLFHFNFLNSGYQIFGWGYKNVERHG